MSWKFESVAVVGAGAVGLYYGGRLANVGNDVRFLLRSDYEAVKRDGLRVESVDGDFTIARPQVFKSSDDIGPVDLVIVSWKATSNHLLESVLPPLLHAGTQVLTLQNGLGNCERIAEIVGPERVMGGLCFVCINRITPGLVRHTAGGRVSMGEWRPGLPDRAAELERRCLAAGIKAEAVANLERSQWEKLIWNIPFNGLSVARGGVSTSVLLADPATEDEIRALMTEVVAAGRALGFDLADGLIDFNINRTKPMGPYMTSSAIDFLENREVEIGPIWEEPLRRATAAGVPMPALTRLLEQIRESIRRRG